MLWGLGAFAIAFWLLLNLCQVYYFYIMLYYPKLGFFGRLRHQLLSGAFPKHI